MNLDLIENKLKFEDIKAWLLKIWYGCRETPHHLIRFYIHSKLSIRINSNYPEQTPWNNMDIETFYNFIKYYYEFKNYESINFDLFIKFLLSELEPYTGFKSNTGKFKIMYDEIRTNLAELTVNDGELTIPDYLKLSIKNKYGLK